MIDRWPEADQNELIQFKTLKERKPADIWQTKDNKKQEALLEVCGLLDALNGGPVKPAICETIGYGGAAFGGKTEGGIAIGLIACMTIPGVQVGYFRRTYPQLEGADGPIQRTRILYPEAGGKYNEQKHIWTFGKGEATAQLHFCSCQYERDVYNFQTSAFDIEILDEATHFTWFITDQLVLRNRISKYSKIPKPFRVYLSNPGNVGHGWYKRWFDIKDVKLAELQKANRDQS